MQQNLIDYDSLNILYEVGDAKVIAEMQKVPSKVPFDTGVIDFLNLVSKKILNDKSSREYPDVVTLAFWMRKASIENLRKRFSNADENRFTIGRGVVFHIAPSNVPVNYAYSLVTGLICGNRNVVRIPSKNFDQIDIINRAIKASLEEMSFMVPYICLIRYGHDDKINDALSSIADVRVVWGGDNTIKQLRQSELKPRATEITFADRYSLAVIDSDEYIEIERKDKVAQDFYNDTYLTDQNACTSPRVVAWTGDSKEEAKELFWKELHKLTEEKYDISGVQAVSKLASGYILAATKDGVKKVVSLDNLVTRMEVKELSADLMDIRDNSGYFFEYDCEDISELFAFCNDTRCQTISYIGKREMFTRLLEKGASGIDRVVPIGKTMDFDFLWDGYNLFERLTRIIVLD